MKNAMGFMYYCKYIVCKKGWLNEKIACNRKTWVEMMKEKYPRPENWHCRRFNNEVYFRYGLQGKLHIICKSSEQYCPNCIQKDKELNKKDKKMLSLLGYVGLQF